MQNLIKLKKTLIVSLAAIYNAHNMCHLRVDLKLLKRENSKDLTQLKQSQNNLLKFLGQACIQYLMILIINVLKK